MRKHLFSAKFHAARIGLTDGWELAADGDLSMGMTWEADDLANRIYDRAVNVGQRARHPFHRALALVTE